MFDWGVSAPRLTYTVWLVSLVYLGLQVVVTFLLYDSVGRYSTTAVATQLKYGHAIVAGGALPFGWRLADCCLRLKAPPPHALPPLSDCVGMTRCGGAGACASWAAATSPSMRGCGTTSPTSLLPSSMQGGSEL